ncbi:MAG: HD domain-containing protein [Lawsonibacter sp.]
MNRYMNEFIQTTEELLDSNQVRMMGQWKHHGHISTLDHSLFVAYLSFRAARTLGLDKRTAARGGLLHDLYLYDSKDKSAHPGWQCFDHPRAAARNAEEITELSSKERNIILSHMWPLGGALPRSPEAFLVDLVDTLCAGLEMARIYHPGRLREQLGVWPLAAAVS